MRHGPMPGTVVTELMGHTKVDTTLNVYAQTLVVLENDGSKDHVQGASRPQQSPENEG